MRSAGRDRRVGVLQARRLRRARPRRALPLVVFALVSLRRLGLGLPCAGLWLWLRLASAAFSDLASGFASPGLVWPPAWPLLALTLGSLGLGSGWHRRRIGARIALRQRRRTAQHHGQNRSRNAHDNPETDTRPHPSRNRPDAPMMRAAEVTMLTSRGTRTLRAPHRAARGRRSRPGGARPRPRAGDRRRRARRAGAAVSRGGGRRHARRDRRRHGGAVESAAPGDPRHAGCRLAEGRQRGGARSRGSTRM